MVATMKRHIEIVKRHIEIVKRYIEIDSVPN
jgi:hypothetical protein